MKTWAVLNDLQIPFHDPKALAVVLEFIRDLKPHGVVLNGDIVDAYELSEFDKNPLTSASIEKEIHLSRWLMEKLESIPERTWVGGNHEDRLRRFVWKNPAVVKKHIVAANTLDFPHVFKLSDHGFKWLPYGGVVKLGKLLVTHGSMVSKHSGWTARSHFDKYGNSVLIGHTHRLGVYYRTNAKGVHAAYENGCLCLLTPEYVQYPDWQQGFSVVHVDDNGMFNVQQIPILKRRMFYYGSERRVIK